HRRNAQGSLGPVGLRDPYPSDGLGLIGLLPELFRQFSKPPLDAVRLDVFEPFGVHPRRSALVTAASVSELEYVGSIHLVVQGIEAVTRSFLRFDVQRLL